jgi:hypothetical protein
MPMVSEPIQGTYGTPGNVFSPLGGCFGSREFISATLNLRVHPRHSTSYFISPTAINVLYHSEKGALIMTHHLHTKQQLEIKAEKGSFFVSTLTYLEYANNLVYNDLTPLQ